eukprot:gene19018-24838_t
MSSENNLDIEESILIQSDAENERSGSINIEQNEMVSELSASEEDSSPWISWFVNMRGNEFFCIVEEDFIQEEFNLTGLSSMVPYYDHAVDMILDLEIPLDSLSEDQQEIVETAAEVLYGLIHARYIITSKGMQKMFEKYKTNDFGRCPRVNCRGQAVIPLGLSDNPRIYPVNMFCPCCKDIYYPKSSKHAGIDGAYFESYVPRIFGFKISKESDYCKSRRKIKSDCDSNIENAED